MFTAKNIYEQVADVLIGRIDGGELIVGDKLPSELDLAEEFQVSRATVVKALRILERSSYVSKTGRGGRRIITVRNKSKRPQTAATHKIVLALPEEKEYFNTMESELKKCCESVGYEYTIARNWKNNGSFLSFNEWLDKKYDGALIMEQFTSEMFDQNAYTLLRKANFPFVMLCKTPRKLLCDSVSFDDYFANYQIVGLLYSQKCNEVIYVTKSGYNVMVSKERQDGYVDRVFRKGQSEAHIFDIKRLADVKALENYVASQRQKFGIVAYNNIVFKEIEPLLIKHGKSLGIDYECASFYEKNVRISKGEKLFYVPKEKIIRRAFQILYKKIENRITDETVIAEENRVLDESVSHIVFSFLK